MPVPKKRSTRGSKSPRPILLMVVGLLLVLAWRVVMTGGGQLDLSSTLLKLGDEAAESISAMTNSLSSSSSALSTAASASSSSSCLHGTSRVRHRPLVIDFDAVRKLPKTRLDQLKQYTVQRYEKFVMAPPGREHYTLMEWLVQTYSDAVNATDACPVRHVGDIGTRYVASALALGSHYGNSVKTFDLPNSRERNGAFRGTTEQDWQARVQQENVHIQFVNVDLLTVSDADFKDYTSTWLMSLDTHHLPYTVPFEREFLTRLVQSGYQGLLVLDDIHLNPEMKKWWQELLDQQDRLGYRCFDLTTVGHATGTGLLDFSGQVQIVNDDGTATPQR